MSRGLFRYDVTTCETKIIPGQYGFMAQLNEGRHLKKRPTEFRIDQVLQAFDEKKFNFTKVGQEEVLFRFEPSDSNSQFWPSAPVDMDSNSSSVVAINVSRCNSFPLTEFENYQICMCIIKSLFYSRNFACLYNLLFIENQCVIFFFLSC